MLFLAQDVPVILIEMLGTLAALPPRSILRCLSKPPTQSRDQVVVSCSVSPALPRLGNNYVFPQGSSSHPLEKGQQFPPPFISPCTQYSYLGRFSVPLGWAEQGSFWVLLSE